MQISVSNKASRPLYEQIVTQIKAQIMSGELQSGEALPPWRFSPVACRSREIFSSAMKKP